MKKLFIPILILLLAAVVWRNRRRVTAPAMKQPEKQPSGKPSTPAPATTIERPIVELEELQVWHQDTTNNMTQAPVVMVVKQLLTEDQEIDDLKLYPDQFVYDTEEGIIINLHVFTFFEGTPSHEAFERMSTLIALVEELVEQEQEQEGTIYPYALEKLLNSRFSIREWWWINRYFYPLMGDFLHNWLRYSFQILDEQEEGEDNMDNTSLLRSYKYDLANRIEECYTEAFRDFE